MKYSFWNMKFCDCICTLKNIQNYIFFNVQLYGRIVHITGKETLTMKNNKVKGVLTDIATEELAHVEMISAMVYQLMKK